MFLFLFKIPPIRCYHALHSEIIIIFLTTTQTEPEAVDIPALAGPAIEALGTLDLMALDTELDREVEEKKEGIQVPSIFRHLARLEGCREEVLRLPEDLSSILAYPGNQRLVYVLLRYKNKSVCGKTP